ncbi:hypothetical protein RQP54_17980 [Curvibacter sp. APW13]|uniref:hypothetical protein n=1 Tax=Curvibacter sp. APW13 TaxID=3077236 RepID=UPI0028DF6BD5|nr:hypothetical protein [Curvibacter sp. APW13]MDT8992767.1 hypothetical protein [Curvibacter sp. APW13]
MKNHIAYMLLVAFAVSAAAQTTTYTEEGGAVIVINQTTGALVSESNSTRTAASICPRKPAEDNHPGHRPV